MTRSLLLWKHLHNMPHIDHQFHSVDNTFVCPSNINDIWHLNTTPYQQSIQMFALIPIVIGFITLFIAYLVIAFCCCHKCYKQQKQQSESIQSRLLADNNIHRVDSNSSDHQQHIPLSSIDPNNNNDQDLNLTYYASISRYVLSFIAISLIICCVVIGAHLDSTIRDVQTNWDDSYDPYHDCIDMALNIQRSLYSAEKQCENIKNTSFPITYCNQVIPTVDDAQRYIQDMSKDMQRYLNEGEFISWGDSSSIDNYRRYLIYFGLSLLSFIAVIIIILTFCIQSLSTMKRCICFNSLLSIILISGILLIWIISSIQFALSINVSDACNDPQNAILQGMNATNNAQIDQETIDIVEYYIYCDIQHEYNPLIDAAQDAYDSLQPYNTLLYAMLPFSLVCDISNETQILFDDYQNTLSDLENLLDALKCDDINGYLNNITSDLCKDGIDYWYLLYSAQVVMVILLMIRGCCICTKSPEIEYDFNHQKHHYNVIYNPPDKEIDNVVSQRLLDDVEGDVKQYSSFISLSQAKPSVDANYKEGNVNERGLLQIKVISCIQLKHAANYVGIQVGNAYLTTKELKKNHHPEWNQVLGFKNYICDDGMAAIITVYSKSAVLKDKKIGSVSCALPIAFNQLKKETLELRTDEGKISGILNINVIITRQ